MALVLKTCGLLLIFIGVQISAINNTGFNVACNDKGDITISVNSLNMNISDVWINNCGIGYTNQKFTLLSSNCHSVHTNNFTFVTIRVNKHQNTTLAINCGPPLTVYRIADGTEFARHNMQFEVGDVDMSFKTRTSTISEDISRVYLGDSYYMLLKYTGKSSYTIIPRKCTVYEGNIPQSGKGIDIWNSTKCVLDIGLTVMENFTYTNDERLYAKMYGFRFSGNGINDITIKCDLTLCLPKTVTHKGICGIKTCKSTRSSKKKTRITSKSLQIIQSYRTENAACQNGTFALWSVSIVLSWLFIKQH